MGGWAKGAWLTVLVAGLVGAVAGESHAQGNRPLPFSNMYSRPMVSPYLQLQQQGLNPLQNQNIYQTMVQPQLQQQQQQLEQLQQRRQMARMQNQVQQIQRDTTSRQVDEMIRPTGHASTFQNLSHFYPARR